jgi:hypothetical protein
VGVGVTAKTEDELKRNVRQMSVLKIYFIHSY